MNEDAHDLALVSALRDGENEAFWTLWMKYSRRLFSVCFREMNRNREDAEDALQETMLRAQERLPRFASRITSPAAWLVRMTSNVCKDIHRTRARDSRIGERAGILWPDPIQLPDVDRAEPVRHECDPAALIARLPVRLREVFVLRVVQQSSYGEIAARLGVTCATARKRVQQSRAALRTWRDADAA